jgi:hypothetical protein
MTTMMMLQVETKEHVSKNLPRMAVARLVGHDGPIPVARFTGKSSIIYLSLLFRVACVILKDSQ